MPLIEMVCSDPHGRGLEGEKFAYEITWDPELIDTGTCLTREVIRDLQIDLGMAGAESLSPNFHR